MPYETDEVKAIKTELESDLKEAVTGLRQDLRDLKGGLSGLVTRGTCDARHEASAAHMASMEKQIRATESRIVDAVQLVKGQVGELINGKLEARLKEMVPGILRDPEFRKGISDETERMEIKKLRRQRPQTGTFTRIANSAKSLAAIITLCVMLVGGCVTGSYYLVGIASLVRQAASAARESASKQEILLKRQQVVMQRIEDRPEPKVVTVEVPVVVPSRAAGKGPRRAASKRAVDK